MVVMIKRNDFRSTKFHILSEKKSHTDDAHNIDATLMRQKSSKTYDRYNSMNIDMTQMFTNSNICPE